MIAVTNFFYNISLVEYSGRSNWLKQVCALGNWFELGSLWIDILCKPFIPFILANPPIGIRDVPVINWIKRASYYWLNF